MPHRTFTLALAYSPGVAAPCKEIAKDPSKVYDYTTKGNLVAVITNGTAVLGLGNIGPLAGKPVMEGKGVLFKQFAGINVFDIELNAPDDRRSHRGRQSARADFRRHQSRRHRRSRVFRDRGDAQEGNEDPGLSRRPARHRDHLGAALINACMITKRKLSECKVVFNGAGAAAISCAPDFQGARRASQSNIMMCDSQGVIYRGRTKGMNKYKEEFIVDTEARTMTDALERRRRVRGPERRRRADRRKCSRA